MIVPITSSRRRLAGADVVLVGPVTPPVGGVAVHIERWAAILQSRGYRVAIVNHFGGTSHPLVATALRRNPLRYYRALRSSTARVVHYHHSRWWTLVASAFARRRSSRSTWIATFHGHEIESALRTSNPVIRSLVRRAFGRFDHLVAVSEGLADAIEREIGRRPLVVPAYLPYVPGENGLESSAKAHADARLIVSAYRVAATEAEDTYGLDIAVEAFLRVALERREVSMELYLSQPPRTNESRRYLDGLRQRLVNAGVESRFTQHVGRQMPPAFTPGAIYLRPSRSDGDAVSIREAIAAGIPVLASDAVDRPAGAQVLPQGSSEAWAEAIASALDAERGSIPPRVEGGTMFKQLIELYGLPDGAPERRVRTVPVSAAERPL